MEASDIESVLEFLRSNNLSVSESALIDDLFEKSQLDANDIHNLLFPIPLSPLKIKPKEQVQDLVITSSDASSDQEFVSLASSTTAADFKNPYATRTLRGASSYASSDRLSQFGTARDYQEFDMQNDLNWYREKDEDYAMPSSFDNFDPFSGQSEDKFVMTNEKENQNDNLDLDFDPLLDKSNRLDKVWPTSIGYLDDDVLDIKNNNKSCDDDIVGDSISKRNRVLQNKTCEKDVFDQNSDYNAAKVDEGDAVDELLTNGNEDEYEVFDLRIIHRKNRTGFEEHKDLPIVLNNVIGSRYVVSEYLGSAAFSKVVRARDLQTGIDVCLKIIKNEKDYFDQSLDEIKLLKLLELRSNLMVDTFFGPFLFNY
ncbi:uncharacterized protein LOC143612075 [Bidens hawaiensis]|uniref:uncharacterized protein LOC143612075 n=1 Tax=Bidens hawaiensis TaxID=980011 RepID=UPI00404B919E